jgi:uncharacterized delta-60 repeat protein
MQASRLSSFIGRATLSALGTFPLLVTLAEGSALLAACDDDHVTRLTEPSTPDTTGTAAPETATTAPSTTSRGESTAPATTKGGAGDATAKPEVLTLSATGHDRFYGVSYDDSDALYAVGQLTSSTDANADTELLLAKFTAQGKLDPSFGNGGVVVHNVAVGTNGELFRGVVVQSTGKVVVSGAVEHVGADDARDRDIAALRFNPEGTLDTTFGADGTAIFDLSTGVANDTAFSADSAWGIVRYDDDRLVISGGKVREGNLDTDFVLLRLTPDGAPDPTFGSDGVFSLDTQFDGVSNNASPRNVTLLPDGSGLIGAGYRPVAGADTAPVLYKVTDDGVLDTTFGTDGVFSERVLSEQTECYAAAVQPTADGGYNLVTTGYGRELDSETTDLVSLRVSSNGVRDLTYGTDGLVRVDVGGFGDNSRKLAVLPDGRILLVGGGRLTSADVDGVVMVLTRDGAPDTSFSSSGFRTFDLGGPADFFWGLALSRDAKTAAIAGIRGVGTTPPSPYDNDDAALLLLPLPE